MADAVFHFTARAGARILVFGDSNAWGWEPTPAGFPARRYLDAVRWPGVLAASLGPGVEVVIDGLVGRTTDLDMEDAGGVPGAAFNGRAALPAAIARNLPLDLVILQLGANDLQASVRRASQAIAAAVIRLAEDVAAARDLLFTAYPAPRALVVTPTPFSDTTRTPLNALFAGSEPASRSLPGAFVKAAALHGVELFDASTVIPAADGIDGIHLSPDAHRRLGEALAPAVRRLSPPSHPEFVR